MNDVILKNSSVTPDLFSAYTLHSMSSIVSFFNKAQSSSVTSVWDFWDRKWASVQLNLPPVLSYELSGNIPGRDPQKKIKHLALVKLLDSWHEEDEEEQSDTWKQLQNALDEDRLSDRKLFP